MKGEFSRVVEFENGYDFQFKNSTRFSIRRE